MPDESMQVLEKDVAVQRNRIPDYRFEGFGEGIDAWQIWNGKNLLPFPGSYQEQPAHVWALLRIFDSAHAVYTKEKDEMAALMRSIKTRH